MGIHLNDHLPLFEESRNLWKDLCLGMAAGIVGTIAMGGFQQALSSVMSDDEEEPQEESGDGQAGASSGEAEQGSGDGATQASWSEAQGESGGREASAGDEASAGEEGPTGEEASAGDDVSAEEEEGMLDDIAVVGPFHREDESAPETLARVGYEKIYGEEPSEETRKTLASEIHWGTGMALGGLYGLMRGGHRAGLDLGGGLLFGTAAWFVNDEILVPGLGLSEGPTAHDLEEHASALGAHVVFGVATAAAAQVLEKVF